MSDVVMVGSPIEGGMSVDLDEVRATPRADQWKHTDLLCGLIVQLRDELARTTGDLAAACEVARERGEARLAYHSPVHLYPEARSPRSPLCGAASSGRAVPRTEGELRGICPACVDEALRTKGKPAETSRTNPDGFVSAQIAETTGLLRSLWLEHHVAVMRLGGPVTDPAATFEAWLTAVQGGMGTDTLPPVTGEWLSIPLPVDDATVAAVAETLLPFMPGRVLAVNDNGRAVGKPADAARAALTTLVEAGGHR